MEPDFSGYVTKVGLRCSDGRTIMPDAFKDQDKTTVPLVWQHSHNDPENVLGHVDLENRDDGVYGYAYFNDTNKAAHAKSLVGHKDITMMSIWANQLIERSKKVMHGAIREVSLVLRGANPGALIDNITIRHSDDDIETLDDEVIIYTGLPVELLAHSDDLLTVGSSDEIEHQDEEDDGGDDGETVKDVYDSMTDKQKDVLHFMVGEAIQAATTDSEDMKQSDIDTYAETGDTEEKGNDVMSHNVFEGSETTSGGPVLTHEDVEHIVSDAQSRGSLRAAVREYALSHGIENIDTLFPDAKAIADTPEFFSRRMEWVNKVLGPASKRPFARIRTLHADITMDEARAKGYVTGELKREEFFSVSRRETTPQTIYKKQKLDRDDIVDITDFDVVTWLKGEMRIMLDEEIARAVLIGDGRDISHEDKINEGNIRPIATDHDLYATKINVNLADASSSIQELVDAIVTHRKHYKGSGLPSMFTSETVISRFMLLKDTLGRRIYNSLAEVAQELRVAEIVPVEAMELADNEEGVVAVVVNMSDYVMGTDRGGEINMFDDFDIDYNQQKYLIETRLSGALVKLRSALVVSQVASTDTLVTPTAPTFVEATGVVTIPTVTGVVYKNADTDATLSAGAQSALAAGATLNVVAEPSSGAYYFATSEGTTWSFTRPEA
jgi:HK97 family phage prohead protease